MMFHDDDAVPDIDGKSDAQLRKESKELKKKLDDAGVAAEMVAPRLWFSPMTIDGAYTSNDPKCRQYAIDRSLRCIDIASYLDTDLVVLWLAREGTYLRESKNGRRSVELLVQALDKMLAHDRKIRIAIEPKPNEPMDHAYMPDHRPRAGHRAVDARPETGGLPHRIRPRHPGRPRPRRRN